jgi:uncharacterized damage-inducible protein DinB
VRRIERPKPGEYAPNAKRYIDLVADDTVLEQMRTNLDATRAFLRSLPEAKLMHRYAAGKWTIKEVVGHIVDDERIYAYRTLRFARGDGTELPGFEEKDYARESGANERSMESMLDEFATVRAATISLFEGLPDHVFMRAGVADGNPMSVRAAAYHIAGHELWHVGLIRERYL